MSRTRIDLWLLFAVLCLMGLGVVMVSSSSWAFALEKHDDERDLAPAEAACQSAACVAAAERAEREGKG